ncbi:MAG: AtpZ/AtpI family protein [Clostridiales bacterium]|nr:AtpZ/AtpI family protein [Clostridiales bacterium]
MNKERKDAVKCIFLILQIGLNMIVTLGLGFAVGYLAARLFDVAWLVMAGLFLGMAAGYRNIYDMVKGFMADKKQKPVHVLTKEELFKLEAEKEFSKWKENRESDDKEQ